MQNADLHAAEIENAMRYQAGTQTAAAGAALRLSTCVIHGESAAESDCGLLLAAGQYLLIFTADAAGDGAAGAVLALNGALLAYTASRLPGSGDARLALQTLLHLTAPGLVTVVNNSDGPVRYTNPVLTVVRL